MGVVGTGIRGKLLKRCLYGNKSVARVWGAFVRLCMSACRCRCLTWVSTMNTLCVCITGAWILIPGKVLLGTLRSNYLTQRGTSKPGPNRSPICGGGGGRRNVG